MAILRRGVIALAVVCFLVSANAQQTSMEKKHQPSLDVTSMDRNSDPCVDFFAYSCGGWIKNNPIPPDESSWDTYSKMQDENTARLRGILEAASAPDPKRNAATQKIGDYYASCTDETAIEAKGAEPLKPMLDRIARISSKPEIADVASSMSTDNVLFRFESIQDYRDAPRSSPTPTKADSVFPTAITTRKMTQSRKISAKNTWPTCRRCFNFSETLPMWPPPKLRPSCASRPLSRMVP